MFGKEIKKLIIVCDDKTEEYANYLMQLVGSNDDVGEEVVGIKDGSVEAVKWLEKDYIANQPTLSSNAYVLFIGNSKSAKAQRANMPKKYSEYGMVYSWLGKRAVMFVEKGINKKDEYDDFLKYAQNYQKEFENALKNRKAGRVAGLLGVASGTVAKKAAMVLAGPLTISLVPAIGIASAAREIKENKKVIDQQYRCLTMALYLDALEQFLEG